MNDKMNVLMRIAYSYPMGILMWLTMMLEVYQITMGEYMFIILFVMKTTYTLFYTWEGG